MRFFMLLVFALAATANAQTYPDRPIRVIITFAPGGPADILARMLQPKLAEFVAYARSGKGLLSYGSPGTGTTSHLYVELFKAHAGIEMTHVPYKGGVPAMSDLMGGQIQALLLSVTLSAPQVRAGKVRAIAMTGERRSHMLPQVPTFGESGYPDL